MSQWLIHPSRKKLLADLVLENRITNGYIFAGPVGSFLLQAGDWFSAAIFCTDFDQDPCGECAACRAIREQRFPNKMVVAGEGKISVDQIRELKNTVKYGPANAGHLVVIVSAAHTMTTEAANSFLKLLEEPLPGVHFVLQAESAEQLLPTIRSRCQIVTFPALAAEDVQSFFAHSEPRVALEMAANCHNNPFLVPYYYERGDALTPEEYVTYFEFVKWPLVERLNFAAVLSASKAQAHLLLMTWLNELTRAWRTLRDADLRNLNRIIENIGQLKYNLNLRLHLENLFIQL